MPIVRSYMCGDCGHYLTVTLNADQWNAPAPYCPVCEARSMAQEFKPVAIGGSVRAKAEKITEDILEKDYHVADIERDHREQSRPKVRYADASRTNASGWSASPEALQGAISMGRKTRLQHGTGLDILQANLKSGAEPDLIELSKRRAMKVW